MKGVKKYIQVILFVFFKKSSHQHPFSYLGNKESSAVMMSCVYSPFFTQNNPEWQLLLKCKYIKTVTPIFL